MKKFVRNILSLCGMLILTGIFGINAEAREGTTILPGIYLQNMDLSGKTKRPRLWQRIILMVFCRKILP